MANYNQSNVLPFKTNIVLRDSVIKLLCEGLKIKEVVGELNVSISSVTRIRKYLVTTGKIVGKKTSPKAVIKVVEPKASTNSYNNADGLNKEIARNKMTKYIVDADIEGTVLSLPYHTCAIEKKILVDAPNTTFLGVELNNPTFVKLKETVKTEKLPIKTYEGKLSDKIYGEVENTYSHIIADYCGGLGKFGREIEYAVKHRIVKVGGVMALTFSKPIRGGKDAKEMLALGGTISNNVNDQRCASDKAFEAFFNKIIGIENSFQFVEIFNYSDDKKDANGKGFPMVLIILKRIR